MRRIEATTATRQPLKFDHRNRGRDGSDTVLDNTGSVYRYFDFPVANQQAFLSAESKGRFFRYQIRDHFRCERMATLHAA